MIWFVFSLMTVLAVAFVVLPLVGNKKITPPTSQNDLNITLRRDQLGELEEDLKNGLLDKDQYDNAVSDIKLALTAEVNDGPTKARAQSSFAESPLIVIILLVLLIPITGFGLYQLLGEPNAEILLTQKSAPASPSVEEMMEMIETLEARMAEDPTNHQGWMMLARSYNALHQEDKAIKTYRRALQSIGNDPTLLVNLADALSQKKDGSLIGEPLELIKRAVEIDPTHLDSLFLLGKEAYDRGAFEEALTYWVKLRGLVNENDLDPVNRAINAARTQLNLPPQEQPVASSISNSAISVTLSVDKTLSENLNPDTTVYIFARAKEGPPIPLAAGKVKVSDLPTTVILDDSMAMSPELTLSNFPEVIIGARVAIGGSAKPTQGDLEGTLTATVSADTQVTLLINRVVP